MHQCASHPLSLAWFPWFFLFYHHALVQLPTELTSRMRNACRKDTFAKIFNPFSFSGFVGTKEVASMVNFMPTDQLQFCNLIVCLLMCHLPLFDCTLQVDEDAEEPAFYDDESDEFSDVFEDDQRCNECGVGSREALLLLCDGCDKAFHLECLSPPLQAVPSGVHFFSILIKTWHTFSCPHVT